MRWIRGWHLASVQARAPLSPDRDLLPASRRSFAELGCKRVGLVEIGAQLADTGVALLKLGFQLPDFYSGATDRIGRFTEGFLLRRLHTLLIDQQ